MVLTPDLICELTCCWKKAFGESCSNWTFLLKIALWSWKEVVSVEGLWPALSRDLGRLALSAFHFEPCVTKERWSHHLQFNGLWRVACHSLPKVGLKSQDLQPTGCDSWRWVSWRGLFFAALVNKGWNSFFLLHRAEQVYATHSRFSPDGYRTRPPSVFHGGGPFPAVAAGREEEQEGRLGEHFQRRESVAAPEAFQGGRGPGCGAEGPVGLGARGWGRAGPGLDRTEGPRSQERAEV